MGVDKTKTLPNGDVITYWKWGMHNNCTVEGAESNNHELKGWESKEAHTENPRHPKGSKQFTWKRGENHPFDKKIKIEVDGEVWDDVDNFWNAQDKICYLEAMKSVPQLDADGKPVLDKDDQIIETNEFADAIKD